MLAAKGIRIHANQDRVSPRGAVGVMQVLPKYAAAKPIFIPNVRDPENNIHAGARCCAYHQYYFNDPGIDQMNKLFHLRCIQAGQNRIVRLRKESGARLDANSGLAMWNWLWQKTSPRDCAVCS